MLFQLSRELLQTDNVAELLRSVPDSIARATHASSVVLYLESGSQLFLSSQSPPGAFSARPAGKTKDEPISARGLAFHTSSCIFCGQ